MTGPRLTSEGQNKRTPEVYKMKKKQLKLLLYIMTGGLAFFVVTFTVYFFNLDMKLTSMIEPLLLKWYDRIPRNQHL